MPEISFVPCCDSEPMQTCRSRDHDVVQKVFLLTDHHACHFAEAARIHGHHHRRVLQFVDPGFNGIGFGRVLSTCALNALLQFAEGDCREADLFVSQASEPCNDCSVRPRFMNLRDYVCVEQISNHSNSTGGRRFHFLRGGTIFSNRGPDRSNSLMLGRDACCRRRHSSMGTKTAASTPRRVTTWGPFSRAASRNSLNRALASCNCQELTTGLRKDNHITSQVTSHSDQRYPSSTLAARSSAAVRAANCCRARSASPLSMASFTPGI